MKYMDLEGLDPEMFVGTGTVAKYFGVSRQTIRNWVQKGYLQYSFVTPSRRGKFKVGYIISEIKKENVGGKDYV